jgi:hypothetical protein
MSTLKDGDDLAASVAQTPNRIAIADLEALVVTEEYMWPTCAPHLTIAVLKLENGFTLVGKSAPADPDNFDKDADMKFAREDALRQLWPLEGYALRCRLSAAGVAV